MHKFFRTVGFSMYQKKHDIRDLLQKLVKDAEDSQIKKLYLDTDTNLCCVRAEMDTDMGVYIYGEMDDQGVIQPEYYVPYVLSNDISSDAECSIQRHTEKETYAGLLEEFRVGISLIYYLENMMEFKEKKMSKDHFKVSYVNLCGLAVSGKILLPIKKSVKQMEMSKVAAKERTNLIEAAKNGDEEAMEALTIEDVDLYSQISKRMMKEDIYSIIDNCFMPCGIECDQYAIIGDILEINMKKNRLTGEEVYDLKLECNDMIFHVAINKQDLIGHPQIGRRFKGQIWMMGTAKFERY